VKGVFITLEGNEGCGKSTQIKLLAAYLKKRGYAVYRTREPGGTSIGDDVRQVLLNPRHSRMTPVTETLLYMASRAQLVEEVLLPRLQKKEQIVLCDRWLDATLAYQGYAGGVDPAWIKALGKIATQGLKPVLSLYLDLPVALGLRRARRAFGPDRIEKKALAYHESVRRGFLRIAKDEPGRFRRLSISSQETVEHVHERVKAEVDRVLRKR
jgi:dTMP kinase